VSEAWTGRAQSRPGVPCALPLSSARASYEVRPRGAADQDWRGFAERIRDEERRHISRELHDTTAQNLAAVMLNLSHAVQLLDDDASGAAPAIEEALALCSRSLEEVRTLSYELHPPLLDEAGLSCALARHAEVFSRRCGVEVRLELPRRSRRLARELESTLFRVTQEALSNVQRHTRGASATVRLQWSRRSVQLEIEDDGRGSGPQAPLEHRARLSGKGLQGMRDGVRAVGGELQITYHGGTRVRAIIPRRKDHARDPAGG